MAEHRKDRICKVLITNTYIIAKPIVYSYSFYSFVSNELYVKVSYSFYSFVSNELYVKVYEETINCSIQKMAMILRSARMVCNAWVVETPLNEFLGAHVSPATTWELVRKTYPRFAFWAQISLFGSTAYIGGDSGLPPLPTEILSNFYSSSSTIPRNQLDSLETEYYHEIL